MGKPFVIGIEGGACSGKTSFSTFVLDALAEHGVLGVFAPEIATIVINGGVRNIKDLAESDRMLYREIERTMFEYQLDTEKNFFRLAELFAVTSDEPVVMLTDRTCLSIGGYLENDEFKTLLHTCCTNREEINRRYDAIVYLVSAAYGAEEFYTCANNPARYERTLEEARYADQRTLQALIGHPNIIIIDNSTAFEEKMKRALRAILRVIGKPIPVPGQKKYRLRASLRHVMPDLPPMKSVSIEQFYLPPLPDGRIIRIRKRVSEDTVTCYETAKQTLTPEKTLQTQRIITEREYDIFAAQRDPLRALIRKTRSFFAYQHQYFRLDTFHEPRVLHLVEIEPTEENQKIVLPPSLACAEEVTGNSAYDNYSIALMPCT